MTVMLTLTAADGATHQVVLAAPTIIIPAQLTAPVITNVRPQHTQNPVFNVANGGSTMSSHLQVFGASNYNGATINIFVDGALSGTATTNGNGNWSYDMGILSDASHSVSASVASGGSTSGNSPSYTFTIKPGLTSLPVAVGGNISDNQSFSWGGAGFAADNDSTDPNTCIVDSTHQLSFTLTPTDNFRDFPSNRTEIEQFPECSATNGSLSTPVNITYEFLLSANSPVNNAYSGGQYGGSAWCTIGQFQDFGSSVGPSYEQALGGLGGGGSGDEFCTRYFSGTTQKWPYVGSSNLTRGTWHTIDLILQPNSAAGQGTLKAWLDGALITNVTNYFASAATKYYWKMGMYRGPQTGQTQTQIIRYRNFLYSQS